MRHRGFWVPNFFVAYLKVESPEKTHDSRFLFVMLENDQTSTIRVRVLQIRALRRQSQDKYAMNKSGC